MTRPGWPGWWPGPTGASGSRAPAPPLHWPAESSRPTMYEYAFVTCPVEFHRGEPNPDPYRRIIEDHARQGWRLVQIFIPLPADVPTRYELIFERPRRT